MIGLKYLTGSSLVYEATHPGQAGFAVLNSGKTCRECLMWSNQRGERTKIGNLKPARCRKALEHLKDPPPIPHSATSCRYLQLNPNPPEP